MKLKGVIKSASTFVREHERVILTVVTIAGSAVAVYKAIKNGPKFEEVLEDYKKKKEAGENPSKIEVAKELAKPAAEVAVPFTIGAVAAIANHKKATELISSAVSLYSTTKTIDEEFRKAVKEVGGEELEKEIDTATYKSKVMSDIKTGQINQVYQTGHGVTKFFDAWSGRYFISDANYIEKVKNDCNMRLMNERYMSLNEFYEDLDLQPIDGGKDLGWNTDFGLIDIYIDYCADEGGQPLGILKFHNAPSWRYTRW